MLFDCLLVFIYVLYVFPILIFIDFYYYFIYLLFYCFIILNSSFVLLYLLL